METSVVEAPVAAPAATEPQQTEAQILDGVTSAEPVAAQADPAAPAPAPEVPAEEEFPSPETLVPAVKSLTDLMSKNPSFAAEVSKNPAIKNFLYQTARQSEALRSFKEIHGSPELAKQSFALAQQYGEFKQALGDPEGGSKALEFLAYAKNPDGSLKAGADGKPEISSEYLSLVSSYRTVLYDAALQSGHPKAAEAVAALKEIMGDGAAAAQPQPGQQPQAPQVPDNDPRLQRLNELEQRDRAAQQETRAAYDRGLTEGVTGKISEDTSLLLESLKGSGVTLTPYLESVLKEKVLADVIERCKADSAYNTQMKFMYNNTARTPEGQSKLINAARAHYKQFLTEIVRKHLGEVSKPLMQQQTERNQQITLQSNIPNPGQGGGVAPPSRPDPAAQMREVAQQKGRRLTEREILDLG